MGSILCPFRIGRLDRISANENCQKPDSDSERKGSICSNTMIRRLYREKGFPIFQVDVDCYLGFFPAFAVI